MARFLVSFALAATFLTTCAYAQAKPAPKMATEAEIRKILGKAADLKADKNGYEYLPNGTIGYKISQGQICTLQKSRVGCVAVYSDGKRLEMIDAKGNREFLN